MPMLCLAKRYGNPHLYELGLPSGEEVGTSLLKAIPLLVIGFIIAYACMWSKKDGEKTSSFGCVGVVIMAIGGIFLLPLLAYVELIFQSILGIVFLIGIVIAVCYGIYSLFKSNK
jgi:hypothetical protein